MKAIIRFKGVYRPVSGQKLGVRLQACIPNMEARRMKRSSGSKTGFICTDEPMPSFGPKYLICESGDYASKDDVKKGDMQRFLGRLLSLGFTEFEQI